MRESKKLLNVKDRGVIKSNAQTLRDLWFTSILTTSICDPGKEEESRNRRRKEPKEKNQNYPKFRF